MTEAEWQACEQVGPMLEFLRGRASDRQLRLFACACCRSIQRFIPAGPCREAVETSLRFADSSASAEELAIARAAALAVSSAENKHAAAAWAACETTNPSALQAARAAAQEAREAIARQSPAAAEAEGRSQADFLRDICGNLFCLVPPSAFRPLRRYTPIQEIAEEIYSGGSPEDMLLLGDEIERLGRRDQAILEHCRTPGPHVRGCWVIDGILDLDQGPRTAFAPKLPTTRAVRSPSQRVLEIRYALLRYLGEKKLRRFLRQAVRGSRGSTEGFRPPMWFHFARQHPEYETSDEEFTEVCTVCWVHHTELQYVSVPAFSENPQWERDPGFLEARGTRFPNSYPEEGVGSPREQAMWWCEDCQHARAKWTRAEGL